MNLKREVNTTPKSFVDRIAPPRTWADPRLHLDALLTHPYYKHLLNVHHQLHMALMQFFEKEGFLFVDLPITTNSVSSPMGLGSDSQPVSIVMNGERTYLSDSMQFFLELTCRITQQNAAYKMISFRGEKPDRTHLGQFQHAECEILGNLNDIKLTAGKLLHFLTQFLLEHCSEAISYIAGTTDHLTALAECSGTFPSISMQEALEVLRKHGPNQIIEHPAGFTLPSRTGEEMLCKTYGRAGVLWITHFPHRTVPFYQAFDPEDTDNALNADLLVCGIETIGAGQRHFGSAEVLAALSKHDVSPDPYLWYANMRDVSPLQTSGFGLGIERYLMRVLQQPDIRDCTLLYRGNGISCFP